LSIPIPLKITGAVEGSIDEAVLTRLIEHVRAEPGIVYGKHGKSYLQKHLSGFNNAAHRSPWFVLVDLNSDAGCAPTLISEWLPNPAPQMCFRVAVRKIEAWLLADHERLARFLRINKTRIPANPETETDPKQTVVNLARESRRRIITRDMVPRPGSGRSVGPAYTSRMIEFVSDINSGWRPEVAAQHSDSLHRCLTNLTALVTRCYSG
jgi:hypothetical protein